MSSFQFNPNATDYDPINALSLGYAARLAYSTETEIERQAAAWGFSEHRFFDRDGTRAFAAAREDLIVVAFRGTETKQLLDILTDVKFRLVAGPFGNVHRGFKEALGPIMADVTTELEQRCHGGRKLWLTGHSLGGALAMLGAAELSLRSLAVQGLYTYGQPRVGDATFAKWFDHVFFINAIRHVNFKDYVTILPLGLMKYRHCGTQYYFDAKGKLHSYVPRWMKICGYARWAVDKWMNEQVDLSAHHGLDHYIRNLRHNLEKRDTIQ